MPLTATELIRQSEVAFGKRGSLMSFWQDTAENFYPERADFTVTKELGDFFASNLYASDPIIFRRDFCNWTGAVLRPKGRPWFSMRARDEKVNKRQSVKVFLEDRAQVTRNILYDQNSQFIRAMTEADHDYGSFGNSVSSVLERADRQGLLFKTWHLKDCAWEDDPDGVTHKMFRKYQMTAENLALRARTRGWKVPQRIIQMVTDRKGDTMIECLHVTMPADLYDMPVKKRRGREFVSVHVSIAQGNTGVMSETPIPVFNYAVSRWFTVSNSAYAFSPCVCASIPDARTMQAMTWAILEAGEKAVDPPLAAVREAILGGVEWYSGGITWIDGKYDEREGEAIRALQMGKEPMLGVQLREAVKQVMGDAWYLNKLFLPPPANQPMTAEEVSSRNAEYLRISQPIIEPAEPERNGKILDITIAMAQHLGYWGDPTEMPKELEAEPVDFAYDNPIEDARKLAKTQGFQQAVALAGQAEGIDPTLKANVDWQTAFREAISGVAPPSWVLPERDAKAAVEQGRQQQQMANMQSQVGQLLEAGGQAAEINAKNAQAEATEAQAA